MTLDYALGAVGKWSHRGLEECVRLESYLNSGGLDSEAEFMTANRKEWVLVKGIILKINQRRLR